MKKKILILLLLATFSISAYAATYGIWYQSCLGCNWQKGSTYSTWGACQDALRWHWADKKVCKQD